MRSSRKHLGCGKTSVRSPSLIASFLFLINSPSPPPPPQHNFTTHSLACQPRQTHSGYRTVADRLAYSPLTRANRVKYPAGPLPDFRKWESCRKIPLASGFSRGSPVSSTLLHNNLKTSLRRPGRCSRLYFTPVTDFWRGLIFRLNTAVQPTTWIVRNRLSDSVESSGYGTHPYMQDQKEDGWKLDNYHVRRRHVVSSFRWRGRSGGKEGVSNGNLVPGIMELSYTLYANPDVVRSTSKIHFTTWLRQSDMRPSLGAVCSQSEEECPYIQWDSQLFNLF
ncbi:hypothetical protein PR048_027340 [Dryococelus australis]|uniref:Uncharacterized protein n=1 Tax=Dryococelus australis TaxID=614101 RepID=A0ABQ9GGM9_9NEOP|nr:hypothetical protein PR048_027340 [Dryococelus australis]